MIKYSFKIEGLNELEAAMKKAPALVVSEAGKAVQRSLLIVDNRAKKEAPVNKSTGGGNLRQMIRSQKTGPLTGVVKSNAKYSGFVEGGTRPHIIRTRKAGTLYNDRTNQSFGRVVNHPGTRANPFFKRAIDGTKEFVQKEFKIALDNVTRKLTR